MKKKTKDITRSFPLSGEGIDSFSEILDDQLIELDVERHNRIRIRFSLEESLLRMRDHFEDEGRFLLTIRRSFGLTQIQVEKEGEIFNPLSKTQAKLEDWSGSLLTTVGLSPTYSYFRGRNILRLSLSGKGINPAVKLLVGVLVGLTAGFILRLFFPPGALLFLSDSILKPFYDLWVRMLTLLCGPMIFLMVLTSIINIGAIEEEGGNSRKVFLRFLLISIAAALIGIFVSGLLFKNPFTIHPAPGEEASNYLDFFLNVVPQDFVTPLIEVNTPQIVFIAFALGNAITLTRTKTESLGSLIRQADTAGLLLTSAVGLCSPFFAALLLCMEITRNSMRTFWGMWGIMLAAILVSCIFMGVVLLYVSRRKAVPPKLLYNKLLPVFLIAIRTGSIDEGFGQMQESCNKELGIEKHFATLSLPFGLILYMPVSIIGTLMLTIYAAVKYNVTITPGWLLIGMTLTIVLCMATPPVPGASLLGYITIFSQLGIPTPALVDAMIFDILFGIFAAAANQSLLQLELILQADSMGLLSKKRLRRSK